MNARVIHKSEADAVSKITNASRNWIPLSASIPVAVRNRVYLARTYVEQGFLIGDIQLNFHNLPPGLRRSDEQDSTDSSAPQNASQTFFGKGFGVMDLVN